MPACACSRARRRDGNPTIPRARLFTKYAALIIALVSAALVASGLVSLYFSYRENQQHLISLQREKATAAATRIEQYILDIEHQLGWTALPQMVVGADPSAQRRFEYLKLLRQVQPITEVVWIDASGREQLRVSRLAMEVAGSGLDLSADPKFVQGKDLVQPSVLSQGNRALHDDRAAGGGRRDRRRGQPQVRVGSRLPDPHRRGRRRLRHQLRWHADRASGHQPGAQED